MTPGVSSCRRRKSNLDSTLGHEPETKIAKACKAEHLQRLDFSSSELLTDPQFSLSWHALTSEEEKDFINSSEVTSLDEKLFEAVQRENRRTSSSRGDDNLNNAPPLTKKPPIVEIGGRTIQPFYVSQYSCDFEDYTTLFICQHCMKYWISRDVFNYHQSKCSSWHPPGDEIYRRDGFSVFEVHGEKFPRYCVNLCLLSKLFLKDKVLCFEVEPFLFYVMVEHSSQGLNFVGYFSKPKDEGELNLSCVMVLPPFQHRGYGRFLIHLSYILSRKEGTWGTPDKPFSALGLRAYESYWRSELLKYLQKNASLLHGIKIQHICDETGISCEDIRDTLVKLKFLEEEDIDFSLKIDWALVKKEVNSQPKIILDETAVQVKVNLHRKYAQSYQSPHNEKEERENFLRMGPYDGFEFNNNDGFECSMSGFTADCSTDESLENGKSPYSYFGTSEVRKWVERTEKWSRDYSYENQNHSENSIADNVNPEEHAESDSRSENSSHLSNCSSSVTESEKESEISELKVNSDETTESDTTSESSDIGTEKFDSSSVCSRFSERSMNFNVVSPDLELLSSPLRLEDVGKSNETTNLRLSMEQCPLRSSRPRYLELSELLLIPT